MLSDKEIETYRRDGVVILRGVVPPEWLDRVAPSVDAAFEGDGTADLSSLAVGGGGGKGRFRAGTDHWRGDPAAEAFATRSPLPAIAAALMGSEKVWLWEDSFLIKAPGTAEETRFHQDLPYFHLSGTQLATFWVPLDPVSADTGSLRFVKGSHLWDREFAPTMFVTDDRIAGAGGEEAPQVDPDDPAVLCVDMEPGDLSVHDARTLHGAGPNTSADRWRRAVSVRYCGDDVRVGFRPGIPTSEHQAQLVEGEPLRDGPVTPQVWPRT
jgi:ectoine hydroxylase-related dioxygenase (phytanoyl-CoA dioxygenase family)